LRILRRRVDQLTRQVEKLSAEDPAAEDPA